MVIQLFFENKKYQANLKNGHDISIPLKHDALGPKCFYAPSFKVEPVLSGNFIGSIEAGSPVNFKNLIINPHGNGTHTESVGHIIPGDYTINQCLKEFHYIAQLISVHPEISKDGDQVITKESIEKAISNNLNTDVVVIRTMPNHLSKLSQDYSGTNPPYFSVEAIEILNNRGIIHLMTDLPSVDREVDGGKLSCHKTFWEVESTLKSEKTITEMVFVADSIVDGLYFCNMQIASIESDASPSKIMLFEMKEIQ